jgi:hypothetical protein
MQGLCRPSACRRIGVGPANEAMSFKTGTAFFAIHRNFAAFRVIVGRAIRQGGEPRSWGEGLSLPGILLTPSRRYIISASSLRQAPARLLAPGSVLAANYQAAARSFGRSNPLVFVPRNSPRELTRDEKPESSRAEGVPHGNISQLRQPPTHTRIKSPPRDQSLLRRPWAD